MTILNQLDPNKRIAYKKVPDTFSSPRLTMLYQYWPNSNNYNSVGLPHKQVDRVTDLHFKLDESVAQIWQPPVMHGFDEEDPGIDGDFPCFSNYSDIPICTQRAWDALHPMIGYCCEALPIIHPNGKPHYIIHCMETIDALDVDRSQVDRFSDGRIMNINQYALKQDLLQGKHIFKIFPRGPGRLIVDDEFHRVVRENCLQGLHVVPLPKVAS